MAISKASLCKNLDTFYPSVTELWHKRLMYSKAIVTHQGRSSRSLKFLSALHMPVITMLKKFDADDVARFDAVVLVY